MGKMAFEEQKFKTWGLEPRVLPDPAGDADKENEDSVPTLTRLCPFQAGSIYSSRKNVLLWLSEVFSLQKQHSEWVMHCLLSAEIERRWGHQQQKLQAQNYCSSAAL